MTSMENSAPAGVVSATEIEAALGARWPKGLSALPDWADSCAEADLQPGMTVFEANEGSGPTVLHVVEVVDLYDQTGDEDLEGMVQVSGVCASTGNAYSYRICGDNSAELVTPQKAQDLSSIANDVLTS
ncbi:hypothetical protein ETD86_46560 [Nonomuraea turkmeniaca]|uniref:Uncharacterized protein n=1 Tax=Nonomuraea turkmeniaca TaxID=103838 RepID=A0A5S4EYF0_9ACTN|nr:hypothetical protein [Nonomuraea turkmeniaca]TMR08716.1 hypothetical protein ETD86_46560 [Nonomuraea turkmeniaca]